MIAASWHISWHISTFSYILSSFENPAVFRNNEKCQVTAVAVVPPEICQIFYAERNFLIFSNHVRQLTVFMVPCTSEGCFKSCEQFAYPRPAPKPAPKVIGADENLANIEREIKKIIHFNTAEVSHN